MIAPRAVLTMYEPRLIEPSSSSSNRWYVSGHQGAVDGQHVDGPRQRPGVGMEGEAEFVFHLGRQAVPLAVVQADVEGGQPAQHGEADPAGGEDPDVHALEVVGPFHAVGDVPAAVGDPVVGGEEVAHQGQDLHDGVLGHADAVAEGHLGHGDAAGDRRVQVDVVGADACGDGQLELGASAIRSAVR